jgi:hypothetical protein
MVALGGTLIAIGVVFVIVGLVFTLGARLPLRIGRLPGDIVIRGRHSVFYFPLMTCLIVSGVLSLVMWLINRR